MTMDLTGTTLALEIVTKLGIPTAPVNPTPEQKQAYEDAVAAQLGVWKTVCNQILTYISQNATLTIPAAGILDHTGGACSGSSTSGTLT